MYLKINIKNSHQVFSRKKLFLMVISAHLMLLLVLFLAFSIGNLFFRKLPDTIGVTIVSSSDIQSEGPASPAVTQQTAPPSPKKIEISQPQEKIEPIIPKPTVKTEKTTPVPTVEKKWKPLDINEIKKSNKVITKKEQPKQVTQPAKSSSDIADIVRKNLKGIQFKTTTGSSGKAGNSTTGTEMLTYYDKVSSVLYQLWDQPSKLTMSNKNPNVIIRLQIDSTGRVKSAKIITLSGIKEMDDSVKDMISKLTILPPPPNGNIEIDASMVLTN